LLIPLACSGGLIAYIYLRSKKTTTWFVDAHWKLAWSRGLWLLLGYAITAVLIFVAWLVSLGARDHNMEHILWTALTRIALMPTLIAVMITAVQEASAIALATKREVPDRLAASFPPRAV
jgi:cell shape-determining protein MreD